MGCAKHTVLYKVNIAKSTLLVAGCSLFLSQMPRELAEPAHVNKYQCAAYLLNRITRCTLTPPPAPPHYHHPEKQPGTWAQTALANAPTAPVPHKTQASPADAVPQLPRATPWLLDPSFKAINHPCTFLRHIPDDHTALGK